MSSLAARRAAKRRKRLLAQQGRMEYITGERTAAPRASKSSRDDNEDEDALFVDVTPAATATATAASADGDESADDSAVTPISAAGGDDPAAATAATADTHSPPPVPSSEDEDAAAADVSEDGAATGMSPGPAVPKTKPTVDTAQMATELRRARDSALYYKRWEGRLRRVLVFGAVVIWLLGNARAARGITDGRDPPGNGAVVDLERACSQRMSDAFGLSGGDERPLAMLAPFVEALLSGAARITATLSYAYFPAVIALDVGVVSFVWARSAGSGKSVAPKVVKQVVSTDEEFAGEWEQALSVLDSGATAFRFGRAVLEDTSLYLVASGVLRAVVVSACA